MTQNFVRFSRDVEEIEPDFERSLQTVIDAMKRHMRGSLQTDTVRTRPARRAEGALTNVTGLRPLYT